MTMQRTVKTLIMLVLFTTVAFIEMAYAQRRILRVALYPYVPQKAEMYWKAEQEFEANHPDIDLQYVDIGASYYSGGLMKTFTASQAEVIEVDTVFLRDLVDAKLVETLPDDFVDYASFLPVARSGANVDGRYYGVPHWVCGNFIFFRSDDPERQRFSSAATLSDLERILGRPAAPEQGLLVDLRGGSTLGEMYFDAVLDEFKSPAEALHHINPASPHAPAINALTRLFALCPGGLCDSEKHHEFGEYYARAFAHRRARALIGYSERMYFVVDEYLHGVREDEVGVGKIGYEWNAATSSYRAIGEPGVEAIGAPLSDAGSTMLAWVDVLAIRRGLNGATKADAETFIKFFSSEAFSLSLLVPDYGSAPRYLLPARSSLYENPRLLSAAPLYKSFLSIMKAAFAITNKDLNEQLRTIGKSIEAAGFGYPTYK